MNERIKEFLKKKRIRMQCIKRGRCLEHIKWSNLSVMDKQIIKEKKGRNEVYMNQWMSEGRKKSEKEKEGMDK